MFGLATVAHARFALKAFNNPEGKLDHRTQTRFLVLTIAVTRGERLGPRGFVVDQV